MIQREILTAQEVADILRVSLQTIIRELKEGSLAGFKVRNQWRIRRESLDDYQKGQGE